MNKLIIDEEIKRLTDKAIKAGVGYDWGSKDSSTGGIDCSGWTCEVMSSALKLANKNAGETIFDSNALAVFENPEYRGSGTIIDMIEERSGVDPISDRNEILEKAGSGWIIGLDASATDNYKYGIDHVISLYEVIETDEQGNQTNVVYVSGSDGGVGVHGGQTLEAYLADHPNADLYAVNVFDMAEKEYRSKKAIEKALARESHDSATAAPSKAAPEDDAVKGSGNEDGDPAAVADKTLQESEMQAAEPAGLFDALLLAVAAAVAAMMATQSSGDKPLTTEQNIAAELESIEQGYTLNVPETVPETLPASSPQADDITPQPLNGPRPDGSRSTG